MKNSLKKVSTEFEIVELEDESSFTIMKEKQQITFYDNHLIEEVINNKFNERYLRLLKIIVDINNSEDAEESDAYLVRDQIEELRCKLINEYGPYINGDLFNKYLKMLLILDEKLIIPEKHRGR